MATTKKMNEVTFAQILKEFHAIGELLRARQNEKQAILDGFDSESKRFFFGKISEKALESSIRKTNKELGRLDREIRSNISRGRQLGKRMDSLIASQSPLTFKATLSGISSGDRKKKHKKKHAKKSVKKSGKKK
jgi:hypothetical protein